MVRAIVGANWGDEGKGKITDMFAGEADIVVRFQGGANAGHTIINEHGRFAFHLMPSGVCYDNVTCIIGNGVALDIDKFVKELADIKAAGLNPHLLVSDRAQVLMPYHILLDTYEEERLGKNAFGSTKSGIAPFFSDKFSKIGIQVNDLFDDETLKAKLRNVCTLKNLIIEHVYHKPLLDPDALYKTCVDYREKIAPFVCDTHAFLSAALKEGKSILLEGQLGTLKDPDFGIYPLEETVEAMMKLKEQGKIRAIGASNVTADIIRGYCKYGQLDVIQEKYSLLTRRVEKQLLPTCRELGVSVQAYSPLEQGLLTGKVTMDTTYPEGSTRNSNPSFQPARRAQALDMLAKWGDLTEKYDCSLAQLVIALTARMIPGLHVLCGARTPQQVMDNAGALNIKLDGADAVRMKWDVDAIS